MDSQAPLLRAGGVRLRGPEAQLHPVAGAFLRRAREGDAERIARLHIQSWRSTYGQELSAAFLQGLDVAERAAEWRRRLADGVAVILAEEADGLDGFVACGPAGERGAEEWEIYNLHVAPLRRGVGLGSRLFDAAAALGRGQGARELVLWVVETNRAARAFYQRKGMRPEGVAEAHPIAPGETLIEVLHRMHLGD